MSSYCELRIHAGFYRIVLPIIWLMIEKRVTNLMRALLFLFIISPIFKSYGQDGATALWHNKERSIRYVPDGSDFIIKNGTRRFNRALYGTNTGFRVEA